MSGYIAQVSRILEDFIKIDSVKEHFLLEPQGVVHLYTQYDNGIIKEFYSCNFKDIENEPNLSKINLLFNVFDTILLKEKGLTVKNVSFLQFDQTAVGPGRRYQAQFCFRGY